MNKKIKPKKVKIIFDKTLNFDGVDFVTKITKPLPDSGLKYTIKTQVTVNGKCFADYKKHIEDGAFAFDNNVLENQLSALLFRLGDAYPKQQETLIKWFRAMSDFVPAEGVFY